MDPQIIIRERLKQEGKMPSEMEEAPPPKWVLLPIKNLLCLVPVLV